MSALSWFSLGVLTMCAVVWIAWGLGTALAWVHMWNADRKREERYANEWVTYHRARINHTDESRPE